MTALDKLIEAVEAGGYDATPDRAARFNDFSEAWEAARGAYTQPGYKTAWRAYHGSLDAALALHEALLPGWWFQTSAVDGWATCYVERSGAGVPEEAPSAAETPARAWLLAILRAYRSVQA